MKDNRLHYRRQWRLIGKNEARKRREKWKMQKKMRTNGKGKEEKMGKNEKVKDEIEKFKGKKY